MKYKIVERSLVWDSAIGAISYLEATADGVTNLPIANSADGIRETEMFLTQMSLNGWELVSTHRRSEGHPVVVFIFKEA